MNYLVWDPVEEFEPGTEDEPRDRKHNQVDADSPEEAAEVYAERIYEEIEFDVVDLLVKQPTDGKTFKVSVKVDVNIDFRSTETDEVTRGH